MFELGEEQKMLQKNAHDFWLKEIDPIVDEREKRSATGDVFSKEETHHYMDILTPLGYVTGEAPPEYGGEGLNHVSMGLLFEELGYFWVSLFTVVQTSWREIARMTDECRGKYAHRIQGPKRDMLRAGGQSESNAGGSPMPRGTEFKAVLDGDYWVCNGTKTWTSGGAVSDYITCITLVDRGKGVEGIGNIFIDRAESPYETREMHKLGFRCCSFTETFFTDCRVPKENMLIGSGEIETAIHFSMARARVGASGTGLAQAALDASIKYAQETKRFGKPIAGFQLMQDLLVNMAVETDCSRFLYLRALDALDKVEVGGRLIVENTRDPRFSEFRKYSSMAKFFCCDAVNRTAYKAVNIHGAHGILDEERIERYYRDARAANIGDGTSEIQRLIVGRELTGISAIR